MDKLSFSSDIKQELNKNSNLVNKEIVKQELLGYLLSGNTSIGKDNKIKFSTESDYNINRFSKLLTNLNINHQIDITGKTFFITIKKKEIEWLPIIENKIVLTDQIGKKEEEKRAFIRGLFMGAGSVNNPENKYHLEIIVANEENLWMVKELLENLGIHIKILQTKQKNSLYLKEGEEISKFLAFVGATQAVLKFEEIRVLRDMKNQVNRTVNCETANLNKTVEAAVKQLQAIQTLQKKGKWENLPENLKEIGKLRLENPHASLIELGKMLKEPIGKSGVNHRMQTILSLASKEE